MPTGSQVNKRARPAVVNLGRKTLKLDTAGSRTARLAHIQTGENTALKNTLNTGIRRRVSALTIKRAIDVTGALAGIVALSPILAFIAVAIKISDSGTVIFRQERTGFEGKTFQIYKFRSIYQQYCDPSGTSKAETHPEHLLPFGEFLRRSGLDELPQLINVLIGEMSLVGPRPHIPGMLVGETPYDRLVPNYHDRTRMRPGLTGWAQCNGLRGPLFTPELAKARVEHDLDYIENFTLWLDLKILAKTFAYLLGRKTDTGASLCSASTSTIKRNFGPENLA